MNRTLQYEGPPYVLSMDNVLSNARRGERAALRRSTARHDTRYPA
jgi:hypothetical protein